MDWLMVPDPNRPRGAGIRNDKVVIDPLLMIIEQASQSRLLLRTQINYPGVQCY